MAQAEIADLGILLGEHLLYVEPRRVEVEGIAGGLVGLHRVDQRPASSPLDGEVEARRQVSRLVSGDALGHLEHARVA